MASITEILTLVVIIVGILILPKLIRPEAKSSPDKNFSVNSISMPIRFGIVLSIITPVVAAIFYRPWEKDIIMFILTGILPLIAGWGLYWVFAGYKKKKKDS